LTHDKSRNIIFAHPKFNRPYHFLANEFLLLLFDNDSTDVTQDYFKLRETFGDIAHLINNCEELRIGILTEGQWNGILNILKVALEKQKKNAIMKTLFTKFSTEKGRMPSDEELNSLYQAFVNSQPKPDWEGR
jgi:hypothetical protein